MRLKLAIIKALHTGDNEQVFRDLEVAANLHMTDVRGEYIVAVLTLLSERNLNKNLIDSVLSFVLRISEQEKAEGVVRPIIITC